MNGHKHFPFPCFSNFANERLPCEVFKNDGFSINKMTRASNFRIRSNGCNYIQTCNFVGIVNWLIATCVLSFGNYLLFDNSSAEGRGKWESMNASFFSTASSSTSYKIVF